MKKPQVLVHVHFVLLDGTLTLDWAGPAEVLRVANAVLRQQGQPPRFAWDFVGPQAECTTSVGARISGIEPLPSLPCADGAAHWVVLAGQVGDRMPLNTPASRQVTRWLSNLPLREDHLEVVCVCAGAMLAAAAGLLAGRSATTHHGHLDELRETEPRCQVTVNRVFTHDGPVWSSAGVTTGIDLMLHRVSLLCGAVVAAQVAQTLVVALRRGPNDPELSPFLQHRNHLHAALHRVQDAIGREPQRDWSLEAMADLACASTRQVSRLFAEHTGISPMDYLRGIRLALAQTALTSGQSVTQAAALAGFHSDTQLRRAWQRAGCAGTPSAH